MASPWTDRPTMGLLGPDPGRIIRIWVALLLRLGIGLSLLSTGLAGYYGMRGGGMRWSFLGPAPSASVIAPFLSGLPYLAIGLGLGLILGFLTTASAIGAGLFGLILPVLAVVQMVTMGSSPNFRTGGPWGNDELLGLMMTMSLPNLLTHAAMVWLSPLENNPYSVDALIFGQNEMEPVAPNPRPIVEEVAPARIGE